MSLVLVEVFHPRSRRFGALAVLHTVASGLLPIPLASFRINPPPPPAVPPINTGRKDVSPSLALSLFLFPFASIVPLPLLVLPIPSFEIPKAFQVGIIGMSPAGDNEQCVRGRKESVGDAWTVESPPLSEWVRYRAEDICLVRNEKADWSLQRRALDQSCVPKDGFVTFCRPLSVLTPIVSDCLFNKR